MLLVTVKTRNPLTLMPPKCRIQLQLLPFITVWPQTKKNLRKN